MNKTNTILPYNLFAEKIVLGSILTSPDSINFVSQVLPVEAFYLPIHQHIYKAALILNTNQQTVDIITISSWLQDNDLIEEIGGLTTLNDLIEKIVTFVNLQEYTALIQDKYVRRLLIGFGEEIINLSYQTNFPLEKIFNKIERKLFKLNQKKFSKNLSTTAEILTEILVELKKRAKGSSFSGSGYTSRFHDLNAMTQGFQKSDLIIIAGRPAMGKTAFSLNIARDIALKYNIPIIFFSLEMTKQQLVYRLLAAETEIATTRLKLGNLNNKEWVKINKTIETLSSLSLHIDDTPNISLTEIHFKIQKIKSQFNNIGAIIIDYLQLLESVKKTENRVQEISQITRNLKKFAREFNIPVIVLSQLSRNVESRNSKRPVLSDLRESGCINLTKLNKLNSKKRNLEILSYNFRKKQLDEVPLFIFKLTGKKPTYVIETNIKPPIFITSNHKLLCEKVWKRADQLNYKRKIKFNLSVNSKGFLFKSIFDCRTKKVIYTGLKKVYDFKINNLKNFFSNGFVLHNSIEQDADIVLMLYRDDYYYEQSKEKNTAEIIIAKHRNGPVGTIKLGFDGYLTKFFNLS